MRSEAEPGLVADLLMRNPSSVWARPGLTLLGWGAQHRIDPGTGPDRFDKALRQLRAARSPLALASFTFDEERGGSVLIVPEVLIRVDENGVEPLIGDLGLLPGNRPIGRAGRGHLSPPDLDGWRSSAEAALRAIAESEVEKVVLSRVVEARFDAEVETVPVLESLLATEPGSHTYLVDSLIGSSPELLISLDSGRVISLSLAGSAPSGQSAALSTAKMATEHRLAADSVEDALAPHCTHIDRSKSTVARFGAIQHLATRFDGLAHPGTVITDLLAALHPTAAVAGTPTKSAIELIREIETHQRGRYSGPIGWLGQEGDGEFAIALRCGLIEGTVVTLYAGAGLVTGSDAERELEETDMKLVPMLRALGIS
jgi:menaquinone-specific isochorismate synthase